MPVTETDRTRFRVKDKVFGRKRVPVDAGKVATLRAAGLSGWRLRITLGSGRELNAARLLLPGLKHHKSRSPLGLLKPGLPVVPRNHRERKRRRGRVRPPSVGVKIIDANSKERYAFAFHKSEPLVMAKRKKKKQRTTQPAAVPQQATPAPAQFPPNGPPPGTPPLGPGAKYENTPVFLSIINELNPHADQLPAVAVIVQLHPPARPVTDPPIRTIPVDIWAIRRR